MEIKDCSWVTYNSIWHLKLQRQLAVPRTKIKFGTKVVHSGKSSPYARSCSIVLASIERAY